MPGGCFPRSTRPIRRRRPAARRRGDLPARAPAAPCRARSPPATATPGWATPPCSTPPSRRSRRGTATRELDDTPIVDGGFFVLMGNDEYLLRQIDAGERDRARDYAAWLLGATGGYAIKIVNPGGVEAWKSGQRNVTGLDDAGRAGRGSRRARSSRRWPTPANALGLPHPVHIHCNNLGVPGNVDDHARDHGGARPAAARTSPICSSTATGGGRRRPWSSAAREGHRVRQRAPRDQRRRRPGDVRPGDDDHRRRAGRVPAAQEQRPASGSTSTSSSRPAAASCPYTYKEKAAVTALQWAVGLELFLLARSVAGGALDRPPERRLVPVVPRADPAADGPERPRRAAQAGRTRSCWPAARWPTGSPASTPSTRSPSSPAPARPGCSASRTRGTSASAPTPT